LPHCASSDPRSKKWRRSHAPGSATRDSLFGTAALGFTAVFNNEGDNEITVWHLSDGDPSVFGLLGEKIPKHLNGKWRLFYTQQHGDNFTWEILPHPMAKHGNGQEDE